MWNNSCAMSHHLVCGQADDVFPVVGSNRDVILIEWQ